MLHYRWRRSGLLLFMVLSSCVAVGFHNVIVHSARSLMIHRSDLSLVMVPTNWIMIPSGERIIMAIGRQAFLVIASIIIGGAINLSGPRGCRYIRASMVRGIAQISVRGSSLDMTVLLRGGANVRFAIEPLLLSRRPRRQSTVTSVIAHVGMTDIHVPTVDIRDVRIPEVVRIAVIIELAVIPMAALITVPVIAVTITNTTVKANVRAPITIMETIAAVTPAPPAWRPKETNLGRQDPCARHPIIIVSIPRPVARGPQITRPGNIRLVINRERWRRRAHGDADADLGLRRDR